MPRLTDEEREKLPLADGSRWVHDQVVDRDVTLIELFPESGMVSVFAEHRCLVNAVDLLTVITAAGLNPWYERCRHLETELTALQERHRIAMKAWGSHLGLEPDS